MANITLGTKAIKKVMAHQRCSGCGADSVGRVMRNGCLDAAEIDYRIHTR